MASFVFPDKFFFNEFKSRICPKKNNCFLINKNIVVNEQHSILILLTDYSILSPNVLTYFSIGLAFDYKMNERLTMVEHL